MCPGPGLLEVPPQQRSSKHLRMFRCPWRVGGGHLSNPSKRSPLVLEVVLRSVGNPPASPPQHCRSDLFASEPPNSLPVLAFSRKRSHGGSEGVCVRVCVCACVWRLVSHRSQGRVGGGTRSARSETDVLAARTWETHVWAGGGTRVEGNHLLSITLLEK